MCVRSPRGCVRLCESPMPSVSAATRRQPALSLAPHARQRPARPHAVSLPLAAAAAAAAVEIMRIMLAQPNSIRPRIYHSTPKTRATATKSTRLLNCFTSIIKIIVGEPSQHSGRSRSGPSRCYIKLILCCGSHVPSAIFNAHTSKWPSAIHTFRRRLGNALRCREALIDFGGGWGGGREASQQQTIPNRSRIHCNYFLFHAPHCPSLFIYAPISPSCA